MIRENLRSRVFKEGAGWNIRSRHGFSTPAETCLAKCHGVAPLDDPPWPVLRTVGEARGSQRQAIQQAHTRAIQSAVLLTLYSLSTSHVLASTLATPPP